MARHMLRTMYETTFMRKMVPTLKYFMFASASFLLIGLEIGLSPRIVGGDDS